MLSRQEKKDDRTIVNNTAELNLLAQNLRDHGEIERLKDWLTNG